MLINKGVKACPFCGTVGLYVAEGDSPRWLDFACNGCGIGSMTRVQTTGSGATAQWQAQARADAVKKWNARAPRRDDLSLVA